eukprot:g18616.t1
MAQAEKIRTETGPLDYDYTEKEVDLCQENLQNHKACSPDKIKNEMLKYGGTRIVSFLSFDKNRLRPTHTVVRNLPVVESESTQASSKPDANMYSAHKDEEQMRERYDSPADLRIKVEKLVALVKASKHMVAFTGAGISTSADPTASGLAWHRANSPCAASARCLRCLRRRTCLWRSGFPAHAISELHGNSNMEVCETCGQAYLRDMGCHRITRQRDHFTGRFCSRPNCNGALVEYTIDFGQNLPEVPLELAELHSRQADLHLALGSSLTVSPACDMPRLTAQRGKLVIVNLQPTPLDSLATLKIHAKIDTVMEMLMDKLQVLIPRFQLRRRFVLIPRFQLRRRFIVGCLPAATPAATTTTTTTTTLTAATSAAVEAATVTAAQRTVFLKSVDVHDPSLEMSLLKDVKWQGMGTEGKAQLLKATMHFAGHYREPALTLQLDIDPTQPQQQLYSIKACYDPSERRWSHPPPVLLKELPEPSEMAKSQQEHGLEYTRAHRQYCLNGMLKANKNATPRQCAEHLDKQMKTVRDAYRRADRQEKDSLNLKSYNEVSHRWD